MKKITQIGSLILLATPAFAFAALEGIRELVTDIRDIVQFLIPVAAGLALLLFFWGLAKFIINAGDPGKRAEGRQFMIWGVVALFVMVSVWGLVFFIQDNLGIPDVPDEEVPGIFSNTGTL